MQHLWDRHPPEYQDIPIDVSVVIPAYNAESYLTATLESCLSQTHTRFEVLVVDDGSTDRTGAIADLFAAQDARVRVFHVPNRGIGSSRNLALKHARGDLIALLDSDDLWMPDYLATQCRSLTVHPWVDVLTSNAINLGGRRDGLPYWPRSNSLRTVSLIDIIRREDSVHIMSVFRRVVVDRIGGFDETLRSNEDYHFWLRACLAGFQVAADMTPRAYYRRRSSSVSADESQMVRGIMTVLRRVRPWCEGKSAEVQAIDSQLARFSSRLLVIEARERLTRGDPRGALSSLEQIPGRDRGLLLSVALRVAAVSPAALVLGYGLRRAVLRWRERASRAIHNGVVERWRRQ